ncbi:MAG TPA: septum formation inhibitor Maf [Firmicutes bacterium]|jgi:septum formation protein|nr:septum formation inhibitor Maf [Bacillota bacterium]
MKQLVLASKSPRRRELLANLGVSFKVMPSQAKEADVNEGDPGRLVEKLARRKAEAVAFTLPKACESLVIGADTIVVLDGIVLGKPKDHHHASAMLRSLSGRWHQVLTGVAISDPESGQTLSTHEITSVKFRSLSAEEIAAYVATKEPLDKAGGYGIQEKGALLVERIDGCYFNVVGLPLVKLAELLARFGVNILEEEREAEREVPPNSERVAAGQSSARTVD